LVPIGKENSPQPLLPIQSPLAVQLSTLARRSGALLVFALAERLPSGGYCLHWVLGPDEIYDVELRTATEGVNRVVRLCMKRSLGQCLWGSGRMARQRLETDAPEA
jgi:hypothetical protein